MMYVSLMLGAALILGSPDAAQDKKDKKQKAPEYQIVQVDSKFHVMKSTEAKEYKRKVEAQYAEQVKAHKEAKQEAKKAKRKFTEKPPAKPKVSVHGKKFKSESEAKEAAAKLAEAEAKKKKKGGGGPSGGTR